MAIATPRLSIGRSEGAMTPRCWEIYNALDRVNFGNPVGDRRSPFFMQSINANLPRTMQLGLRYTF